MPDASDLRRALDRAYAVFAASPPPRHADACDHCFDEAEVRALLATAPRDLTTDQVRRLLGNLGMTFGGPHETRWYAPRLVASMADPDVHLPPAFAGGALRRAGWPEWPRDEVEALRAVTAAVVETTLAGDADGDDIAGVLEGVARFERDLAPYLAIWDRLDERPRSLALLRVLSRLGADFLRPGPPKTGWWRESPEAFEALRAFVRDPERLVQACAHLDDDALGGDAADARIYADLALA